MHYYLISVLSFFLCLSVDMYGEDPFLKVKCFPDIEEIIKRKKIIVAIHKDKDSKPYCFEVDGKLIGYEIELAKKIAHEIDPQLEVEFLSTAETYNDIVGQVSKGEADIALSTLSFSSERAKRVLYVNKPYIRHYSALLLNRRELENMPDDVTARNLFTNDDHKPLCVIGGSSNQKLVEILYPCAKLVLTASPKESLAFLKEKKCIAYFSSSESTHSDMMEDRKLNLNYLPLAIKDMEDPYYVLVNPKQAGLHQFITILFERNSEWLTTPEEIYVDYKEYYK